MPETPGPGVRIYMQEEDFKALLDHLEETDWQHPVRWKIKTKWTKHVREQRHREEDLGRAAFVTGTTRRRKR